MNDNDHNAFCDMMESFGETVDDPIGPDPTEGDEDDD